MSSSNTTSCILKGCDAKFINRLVMDSFNSIDIKDDINNKTLDVVNSYDIRDCINIIVKFGDFHDIYVKLHKNPANMIQDANKLRFHRQAASIYVKEIIEAKIKVKLDALKLKQRIARGNCDMTCSICLSDIEVKDGLITRCYHVFHKDCMTRWGKNICPMCRGDI